jgi:phosphatidate cytidylyltransferase
LWQAVALTAAANIAGQLGDLAESAMKRGAHVKDSGGILPGHGGFLDRVDSTLFALPVIYAYLMLV